MPTRTLNPHDTRWHLRHVLHEDTRAFDRILEFHELTRTWLAATGGEALETYLKPLERGMSPELKQAFLVLAHKNLNLGLEADAPRELLVRLEHVTWAAQAWTLKRLLEKSTVGHLPILKNQLNLATWKLGREAFQKHWPHLPAKDRGDLRVLLAALQDTWVGGTWSHPPFLTRRAQPFEVDVEWLRCPHNAGFIEAEAVRDDLCSLHREWIRGFLYEGHPQAVLDHRPGARCGLVARFHLVS